MPPRPCLVKIMLTPYQRQQLDIRRGEESRAEYLLRDIPDPFLAKKYTRRKNEMFVSGGCRGAEPTVILTYGQPALNCLGTARSQDSSQGDSRAMAGAFCGCPDCPGTCEPGSQRRLNFGTSFCGCPDCRGGRHPAPQE